MYGIHEDRQSGKRGKTIRRRKHSQLRNRMRGENNMKYRTTIIIRNPEDNKEKELDLVCEFAHDEDQYGNGYSVRIADENGDFERIYDLRYDEHFNPDDKIAWIHKWAVIYWSGKNGAWKIIFIDVEPIAE